MLGPLSREGNVADHTPAARYHSPGKPRGRLEPEARDSTPGDPLSFRTPMDPGSILEPPLPKSDGYPAFVYRDGTFFASVTTVHHAKTSRENVPVTLWVHPLRFSFNRPDWDPGV